METCEKAFAQLSNLQNHMKQHEKELHPPSTSTSASNPARDGDKKPYSVHVSTTPNSPSSPWDFAVWCKIDFKI